MQGQITANIKFEDFTEQWLTEYAEIRLKPKSIEGYRWMSKRIYKAIGHLRLDKITARHLQKFIVSMTEENAVTVEINATGDCRQKLSRNTSR